MAKRSYQVDKEIVEDIIANHQRALSSWELDFIDGMNDLLMEGRGLTKNQGDRLDEIWQTICRGRNQ